MPTGTALIARHGSSSSRGKATYHWWVHEMRSPAPLPEDEAGASMRTLMAVVFIDVVGFSALVERDEAGTHSEWSRIRRTVIEPQVIEKGGRIIKSTGDGFLIQFRSAVSAVSFAVDVQTDIASEYNEPEPAIHLRIAVHVGDVISEPDDLFGDSVNVAARLQEHADPGGIILSAAAHEQAERSLRYRAVDAGLLRLKNIRRPVRAFKISRRPSVAPLHAAATHRPSIAVLPFKALGDDAALRYASEGMAHSIVASLAGLRELFVLASSSTVAFTRAKVDGLTFGRSLGVRYLVSGSLARSGQELRMRVEMSDVENQTVIWTNSYSTAESEIFGVQDEIAMKLAHALLPMLRHSEMMQALRTHPEKLDAYDLLVQALYRLYKYEGNEFAQARTLLLKAIEADPEYSLPYAYMAKWHILRFGQGYSQDPRLDGEEAARYAQMAIEKDPFDPLALAIYGHTLSFLFGRCEEAVQVFEHAIATCPNSAVAWGLSSPTYCYLGQGDTAIVRSRHALALSPLDPCAHFYQTAITLAHYFSGQFDEAIKWGRKTLLASPRFTANMRPLIASLVATDQLSEARHVAEALARLEPQFRVGSFCERYPIRDRDQLELLGERLCAAGLPR